MNKDAELSRVATLAATFANLPHPNYLRIRAVEVQKYFPDVHLTQAMLMEVGMEPGQEFVDDEEGLRLSFAALHRLVFRRGDYDLMDTYDFVDNTYQVYARYAMEMRSMLPTHWALIERVAGFTKSMQPHLPSGGKNPHPPTMNAQPRVFCVVKGTHKSIARRLANYAKAEERAATSVGQESAPRLQYSSKLVAPVFEKVLPDIEDEIAAVMAHLCATSAGTISTLKRAVLIDSSQESYSPDMLSGDIKQARLCMKQGRQLASLNGKSQNFSDLAIFKRTNGKFMDSLMASEMHPREEDVCLVCYDAPSPVQKPLSSKWRKMSSKRKLSPPRFTRKTAATASSSSSSKPGLSAPKSAAMPTAPPPRPATAATQPTVEPPSEQSKICTVPHKSPIVAAPSDDKKELPPVTTAAAAGELEGPEGPMDEARRKRIAEMQAILDNEGYTDSDTPRDGFWPEPKVHAEFVELPPELEAARAAELQAILDNEDYTDSGDNSDNKLRSQRRLGLLGIGLKEQPIIVADNAHHSAHS
ncbi:hypothetical protein PC121_g24387 [Phytophthora cactorum]|nr:hypothetical protein PC121_g24387 [Phytophthora cactorum]